MWQLIFVIAGNVAVLDYDLTAEDCANRFADFVEFADAVDGELYCETTAWEWEHEA